MRSAAHISLDATVSYNNDETDVPISDGVTYSDIIKNGGELPYIKPDLLMLKRLKRLKALEFQSVNLSHLILSFYYLDTLYDTRRNWRKLNMSQANVSQSKGDALKRMGMILELECRENKDAIIRVIPPGNSL